MKPKINTNPKIYSAYIYIIFFTFISLSLAIIFDTNAKITAFSEDIGVFLENVNELSVDITEIIFHDSSWNFLVERNGDEVSVFLEAIGEVNYQVSVNIELESQSSNSTFEKKFGADFRQGKASKLGTTEFISWSEFMNKDNKYVVDNIAIFNLKFHFYRPCVCSTGFRLH